MPRTETLDFDADFDVNGDVTKANILPDGRRMIRGVASGIKEDLQGERVTANAIRKMAAQVTEGIKLTAGGHDQDFVQEIGDVVGLEHDVEHDELLVKCVLPPEGEDAIADKAWTRMTKYGEKMGFSIGGKLRKAFYEQSDTGKRRKALDEVQLRHVLLTKKPAYRDSFAECIAKSMPDAPDSGYDLDDDVTETYEPVAKDASAADQTSSSGAGDRNAGVATAGSGKLDVNNDDDKSDDDDGADDLPRARHLACPNCGHEFAADLPAEAPQDTQDNPDGPSDDKPAAKAPKEPTTMKTISDSLDALKALIVDADAPVEPVAKTDPDEPVTKTDDDRFETVEKMLAASHRASTTAIEDLTEKVNGALEGVAKTLGQVVDRLNSQGTGRRSVARDTALDDTAAGAAARSEVDDENGERKVAKAIDEADSAVDVIKIQNRVERGIR